MRIGNKKLRMLLTPAKQCKRHAGTTRRATFVVFCKSLLLTFHYFQNIYTHNFLRLHTLCFIRNAYKERFWPLVKILGKIRNRLVIFQKIKEQKWLKTCICHWFEWKCPYFDAKSSIAWKIMEKLRNENKERLVKTQKPLTI